MGCSSSRRGPAGQCSRTAKTRESFAKQVRGVGTGQREWFVAPVARPHMKDVGSDLPGALLMTLKCRATAQLRPHLAIGELFPVASVI